MRGDNKAGAIRRGTEPSEYENPEWVVSKSLLEVNDACSRTLEEFLLQATRSENDLSGEALEEQMDDLITRHERLIAELELAKRALRDVE
jgi:hypothetical protein